VFDCSAAVLLPTPAASTRLFGALFSNNRGANRCSGAHIDPQDQGGEARTLEAALHEWLPYSPQKRSRCAKGGVAREMQSRHGARRAL
jgi:hypothetical protein